MEVNKKYAYMFDVKDEPINSWGFEFDEGWKDIFEQCLEEIFNIDVNKNIRIVQAKEKFGLLRIYCQAADNDYENPIYCEAREILYKYEDISSKICEVCGKAGAIHSDQGWLKTVCECHKK